MNDLFKLHYNDIKLSLLQKCSTSFNWIEPAQRSIGRNNPNTQQCQCLISSTSFSTCTYTCSIHPKRPAKNYETLYKLVYLGKLSKRPIRRPAEGMIPRLLLRQVTYRILLLLQIMQGLFQYRRCH